MIDRSIAPQVFPFPALPTVNLTVRTLSTGIPCYCIGNTQIKLLRMDIRIKAGSYFQTQTSVARACIKLLTEGTEKHSSEEISEIIDYSGCYFESRSERDFAVISIYFPATSAQKIFPLLQEMFTQAVFQEDKIKIFKQKIKNSLAINLEKTSYLGYCQLAQRIFGADHPYGTTATMENIDAFTRKDVLQFYRQYYHAGNMRIFLAGNINEDIIDILDHTLGQIRTDTSSPAEYKAPPLADTAPVHIAKPSSMQASIYLGKKFYTLTHPRWNEYEVLNTLLGGYFGSRLMTNIREDKGLAYNISSRMSAMVHDGVFYIHADVNKQQVALAVKEIYAEMNVLKEKLVDEHELITLKNYMYGSLLRNFDGVFSQLDRVMDINDFDLSMNYFEQKTTTIKSIQASALRDLAQELFTPDFVEVVVG